MERSAQPSALSCSFCGKSQQDVRKLIAGPKVYICDECVVLCQDILLEQGTKRGRRARLHALADKAMSIEASLRRLLSPRDFPARAQKLARAIREAAVEAEL